MEKILILFVGKNHWLIRALRGLVESEPIYVVHGACESHDAVAVSRRIRPDVVIFLPDVPLVSCQETLLQLCADMPQLCGIVITPEDATPYEDTFPDTSTFQFVSHARLHTDLMPKIHEFFGQRRELNMNTSEIKT